METIQLLEKIEKFENWIKKLRLFYHNNVYKSKIKFYALYSNHKTATVEHTSHDPHLYVTLPFMSVH